MRTKIVGIARTGKDIMVRPDKNKEKEKKKTQIHRSRFLRFTRGFRRHRQGVHVDFDVVFGFHRSLYLYFDL